MAKLFQLCYLTFFPVSLPIKRGGQQIYILEASAFKVMMMMMMMMMMMRMMMRMMMMMMMMMMMPFCVSYHDILNPKK